MRWKDINFKTGTFKVKASQVTEESKKDTKTENSYRLVKPFPNLWDYMDAHKATRKSEEFVFPTYSDAKKMWFKDEKRITRCTFSRVLGRELRAAGAKGEDFGLSMRRWWSTTMDEKGLAGLESIMGGHDQRTARQFYTNRESIVKAAKVERV